MRIRYLGPTLLLAAVVLPILPARAADVSVGVGVGFCGHPRRYYRPCYPGYYYRPYAGYYYDDYYGPPPGYYYDPPGPPIAPYSNYDDPEPEDWPKEHPADRQDHGALITARGWTAFADGRFVEAADRFTDAIDDHPSLGIPRIGYALTAARLGDLPNGVRAMREALHYDPKALNYVPSNELIDAKIDHLIQKYKDVLDQSRSEADPAFMLAALDYLRGHVKNARNLLDLAIRSGDDSVSTQNLGDLLNGAPPSAQTPRKAAPRSTPPGGYQK